jgi:hypothetical protein
MQATVQSSGDLSGSNTQRMPTSLIAENPLRLFGGPIEMHTSLLTTKPSSGLFGAPIETK